MSNPSVTGSLRIGIDGRELLPDKLTGIGRYLGNFLSFALPTRPDYRFIVYGNQHTRFDLTAPNLTFRMLPERNTLWWDQVVLARCARQDQLSVFFSPYDKAPLITPCPVVLTVHDLTFLVISERRGIRKLLYNTAYMALRAPIARRATRIITDSDYSKSDIVNRLRIPKDRVAAVPIGVPASYHPILDKSQIDAFRTRYGLSRSYILYVGNFKPHKNVDRLLEAYACLPEKLKSVYQLVLCGRQDRFRNEIEATASRFGLKPLLLDFVTERDMPLLYSAAELLVFPSLYEGFGLPPLEAMACGTPVISSNATSLPEVVGDGGILVDARSAPEIRQAIERFFSQSNLRQLYIEAGLRRARLFSFQNTCKKLLSALEEVAAITRQNRL